jgi:hypothetical protein
MGYATCNGGSAIMGAEEGDEVDLSFENGRQRKVLVESVSKGSVSGGVRKDTLETAAAV